ncbi:MAG: UDP-N-acetylglucosamine 2-epimerase (non-hydrolyzing) [Methanomassiliicoccales archaeon]|jgi:UDP-N-acetylglucosamine 2-epimerase (non-hydrolysing)
MKVMTVLGTRPEIIRLSRLIPLLDKRTEHVLVNTNQNFDRRLNALFFEELAVRSPDYELDTKSSSAMAQVSKIIEQCDRIMEEERPDKLLILGDTNSGLSAFAAKRRGIPVYHMEAGNRCFDDRVPEEVNRRVIDHCSDVLMPYTERSRANLVREGIPAERTYVIGNPIKEVLDFYSAKIDASGAMKDFGVKRQGYLLATLHRAETVDEQKRLGSFVSALGKVSAELRLKVIWSVHPRTKKALKARGLPKGVVATEPLGLFDFVHLEKNAAVVLTDSGTVQEECCIFGVPNVTLRDVTERPETIESGSNMLSGSDPESILRCVRVAVGEPHRWELPAEYRRDNVSQTALRVIVSHRE